ncbi:MAG: hypothetical protein K0B81_03445 [Candidatus Cloacimonetes bacterium]|nr:hypothetical protein [Candidatus Cloacimonadota bacterium]
MLRKRSIIFSLLVFCFIILLLTTGCSTSSIIQTGIPEDEIGKLYSPTELLEDLNFLFQTMEEVHPDLFAFTPEKTVRAELEKVKSDLQEPTTRLDFFLKATPIITMLGDGHTGGGIPRDGWNQFLEKGGKFFPLKVNIRDKRAILITDHTFNDLEIIAGSEILSINGLRMDEIITRMLDYSSGERISFREKRLETVFHILLWTIYNLKNDFMIEFLCVKKNDLRSATIEGITLEDTPAISHTQEKPYSFKIIEDLNVGFIDFCSFIELEKFNEFLADTFRQIQEKDISHLIIDIRNNGGGNSLLGDAFLNYLTSEPFTLYSAVEIKISKQIKEIYKEWDEVLKAPIGTLYTFPIEEKTPEPNPFRYEGKVYLLTGPFTFSSASDFAAAIKYYDIAVIIGEETGGMIKCFGDLYIFSLPNTGLQYFVSHKAFIGTNHEENLYQGVKPHYHVEQTSEDLASGKDTVLNFTLDLIRSDLE